MQRLSEGDGGDAGMTVSFTGPVLAKEACS
jgi:hypothetical protein